MRKKVSLKFMKEMDSSYNQFVNQTFDVEVIPSIGEHVYANQYYHRVEHVAHDYDDGLVELWLSESVERPSDSDEAED